MLVGGGCAAIHTGGWYQSEDLDFLVQSSTSQALLDEAMAAVGFARRGDQYFHRRTRFFVDFPPGPLGIGRDLGVRPVRVRIRANGPTIRALSATDSCRDRLAIYYHWADRQSLETAVQIALRNRVNIGKVRRWSAREGARERFQQFWRELRRRRKQAGKSGDR